MPVPPEKMMTSKSAVATLSVKEAAIMALSSKMIFLNSTLLPSGLDKVRDCVAAKVGNVLFAFLDLAKA